MLYSYETMLSIYRWLMLLIFTSVTIDSLILFLIRKENLQVNNHYVKLQSKYSFKVLTAVKVLFTLFLSYFLLRPPGNAGAVGAIAIVYCLIVTILIKDFFKVKRDIGTRLR